MRKKGHSNPTLRSQTGKDELHLKYAVSQSLPWEGLSIRLVTLTACKFSMSQFVSSLNSLDYLIKSNLNNPTRSPIPSIPQANIPNLPSKCLNQHHTILIQFIPLSQTYQASKSRIFLQIFKSRSPAVP